LLFFIFIFCFFISPSTGEASFATEYNSSKLD